MGSIRGPKFKAIHSSFHHQDDLGHVDKRLLKESSLLYGAKPLHEGELLLMYPRHSDNASKAMKAQRNKEDTMKVMIFVVTQQGAQTK